MPRLWGSPSRSKSPVSSLCGPRRMVATLLRTAAPLTSTWRSGASTDLLLSTLQSRLGCVLANAVDAHEAHKRSHLQTERQCEAEGLSLRRPVVGAGGLLPRPPGALWGASSLPAAATRHQLRLTVSFSALPSRSSARTPGPSCAGLLPGMRPSRSQSRK